MGRRRTNQANMGFQAAANVVNSFGRALAGVIPTIRQAGGAWRTTQGGSGTGGGAPNTARAQQGPMTSLLQYKYNSALLGVALGGAQLLGQGVSAHSRPGGNFSNAISAGLLGTLADHFNVGNVFGEHINPIRRAMERTGAITSQIKALGGDPSQVRDPIYQTFLGEEQRREQEFTELQNMYQAEASKTNENTRVGMLLGQITDIVGDIRNAIVGSPQEKKGK